MENLDLYNKKVGRILKTVNHEEPDKIPSLAMIGTWAVSYANSTINEIEKNPEKEIDIYCKPFERLYADAAYTCGIGFDPMSSKLIGGEGRFISPDGQTIQHKEVRPMTEDDYPAFIADPIKFMQDVILPRKAARLEAGYPESYNAIKEFITYQVNKKQINAKLKEKLKQEYAIPVAAGPTVKPPMDIIFDCLRGFQGVSTDLRRCPELFLDAVNALDNFANTVVGIAPDTLSLPDFPFYATMMHVPTFISPKQFEKFFWPTYERTILRIHSLGGKMIMFLEGKWQNKYEYLNNLPKNFVVGIIEGDDIFDAKKNIGGNLTVVGGMPIDMIKFGNKKDCIDYAKKLLDECAPGGGYMFSSSRELISKNDINFENLIALHDYVRGYQA